LKLCGGYIGTNVNGQYYSSAELDSFWKTAEELDALIVMHPEDVAGADRMDRYGLKLVCGNPAESALSLGYMIYSGLFDRIPNLKLCVLHGGGFFPYHLGRFDQGWALPSGGQKPEANAKPSAYLRNLYFDSLVHRADTLDYLRRIAGADHIMVGTDYPFVGLGDWKAVEMVERLDCTDAEKLAILKGNARRLFHLGVSV
jgi:aminocarboxymuconate-semialdehyde decarboxylase